MKTPILDGRSKAELMEQFARLAAEYVPEWHYTGDSADPGAALAELFGEMFYQTVDRFNAVPQKLYTEFLNLLGVQAPPATPAAGLVQFQVHEGVEETVSVPGGAMLYARDQEGEYIVYETERPIAATPAALEAVYYADAKGGIIQQVDLSRPQPFFAPVEGENLQCHRFAVSQNDVLSVQGPCEFEVSLRSHARFLEEDMAQRLADGRFARWSWRGEAGLVPFDAVRRQGERLILTKSAPGALVGEEDGRVYLYCDMSPGEGAMEIDGLHLRSIPLEETRADSVAHNDIPISQSEGGYCFGRMPAPYELFYIRSDCTFRKRGAQAKVRLDIAPVVYTEVDGSPQYVFDRRIIDKKDAVTIRPDDVFVREVVWEYYNGSGWASLTVEGNKNPFSGKETGPLELRFTVPEDIQPVLVNAELGGHIRARVVEVENSLSTVPRWILPFVRSVTCGWQYGESRPADCVRAVNNAREQKLEDIADVTELRFEVYADMDPHPRSMYLCFDKPVQGMPVSMQFDLRGKSQPRGKLLYEAWRGGQFEQIRVLDDTHELAHTGPVYLYLDRPLEEAELFGRRGYWLRISLSRLAVTDDRPPVVGGVRMNVAPAVQRQRAPEQRFSTGLYEAGKTIRLLETPVMWCELWVDEALSMSAAELERLERDCPEDVRAVWEDNSLTSCLVRWRRVDSLAQGGPDERIYQLDTHTGVIRFGDGIAGRVPPAGFNNIRVTSAYGGGTRGNLPTGAVTEFLVSVPRIAALRNITPMGGGTDRMETGRLEALGNRRLRHRGRAVGVRDFEELVAERFGRVAHVKCFTGLDENGEGRPGHLCLVVMGENLDGEQLNRQLCEEIYQFLSRRCDCTLAASGRLHVRPAVEMTINVSAQVTLRDLDQAARTQQEILEALDGLIDGRWRKREIGQQIRRDEVYSAVKAVPNVGAITRIMVEGTWHEDGRLRVSPVEGDESFPFAVVRSGTHLVRIN